MLDIVKKYDLSGNSVLRNWLKWYNTPKWNVKVEEFMAREKENETIKEKRENILKVPQNTKLRIY